ncbi:unnamed protein product [Tilletia controversa]|nr:unnamed protein product [Tilletia controversa]CAD6942139.1 unnamed protein product [Tilletia controversa]CAD6983980.1 unnamed protein product [Tilletia controversa]
MRVMIRGNTRPSRSLLAAVLASFTFTLLATLCIASPAPWMSPSDAPSQSSDAGQHVFAWADGPSIESVIKSGPEDEGDLRRARGTDQKAVQWDQYSMVLAGKRTFLFSVEFHPWRLPVPGLWRDVLEKFKVAGFNCVSIYTHWGLMQPTPDPASLNFDHMHDLGAFLDLAKEVGLFVIVRPGPYINAETTAGGMATWTTRLGSTLRTNATEWEQAWTPYLTAISDVVKPRQLVWDGDVPGKGVSGGSVIAVQADNEYHAGPKRDAYIRSLVQFYKDQGFWVPITYNDIGQQNSFVDIVDLWGLDSYPLGFDCSHPDKWQQIPDDYLARHERTNPDQPFMIPEWQGGSYDPYGGEGFGACAELTGPAFTRLATEAMLAQRVTWLSFYMGFGGTNWGGLASPDVYTSYDYAAPISESRQLTPKYGAVKALAHLIRSFPDLAKTERVSVRKRHDGLMVTELRNPETNAGFYFVRHTDSSSREETRYELAVNTSQGLQRLPRASGAKLALAGRASQVICTDRTLPGGHHLLYTTASLFFAGAIDGVDVLVMYAEPEAGPIETVFAHPPGTSASAFEHGIKQMPGGQVQITPGVNRTEITYDPKGNTSNTAAAGAGSEGDDVSWLYFDFGGVPLLLVYAHPSAVDRLQANIIANGPVEGFANFWELGAQDTVLSYLSEPGLVRSATYSDDGSELRFEGQTNVTTLLKFVARQSVKTVTWNGESVPFLEDGPIKSVGLPGLSDDVATWTPPSLEDLEWTYADSLPELQADFPFDEHLVRANKTAEDTVNPYFQDALVQTQGQVLFASEYGFHGNFILWRGGFRLNSSSSTPSDELKGIKLHLEGGRFFAFSVWLNGRFLGSATGDKAHGAVQKEFTFGPSDLVPGVGAEQSLVIVQDHTGIEMEYGDLPIGLKEDGAGADHPFFKSASSTDQYEAVKLPRGIISYDFIYHHHHRSSTSRPPQEERKRESINVTWHLAGNLHGEDAPDRVRSHLNEGGLFAERAGWHLPGFNGTDSWERRSPLEGIGRGWTRGQPGVGFFRAEFGLDVPGLETHDVSLAFRFPAILKNKDKGKRPQYRALLYVNGWQMGKYVPSLGPQDVFPVPRGILDYSGTNSVGLALWALEAGERHGRLDGGVRLEVVAKWRGPAVGAVGTESVVVNNPTWEELRGTS